MSIPALVYKLCRRDDTAWIGAFGCHSTATVYAHAIHTVIA